jgi:hypothetical protein
LPGRGQPPSPPIPLRIKPIRLRFVRFHLARNSARRPPPPCRIPRR